MIKCIMFPYNDKIVFDSKILIIKDIIGSDHILQEFEDRNNKKGIIVRATKKQWKKIKKELNLDPVYI